ncbi:MAG: YicC family protein [Nitrospinae bacterium]|nr:YicC family protein [Nitrospinota bacterium]MBF0634462.1 YicC family protein [Nitrospinota bacterium]
MACSMTGFGRTEKEIGGRRVVIEAKSVNHRYLEVNVKLFTRSYALEETVRQAVKERFGRGYFEVSVMIQANGSSGQTVTVNEPLLDGYLKAAGDVAKRYGVEYPPRFGDLALLKDLFTVTADELPPDDMARQIAEPLGQTLDQLAAVRKAEGDNAICDVKSRFSTIKSHLNFIISESESTVAERFDRLRAKIQKLVGDLALDETRLAQEAAILADRADISEETERAKSHLKQVDALFDSDEPVGRKLEFFLQEISREVNTMGSKSASPGITLRVVEMKSEMEKIREQAQNLE